MVIKNNHCENSGYFLYNYDWFKYMQPFNISKSLCQSYVVISQMLKPSC